MDAQQLYRAGKLTEAISALSATLRDNPSDLKSRTFLFELLCFAGEFDRAEKQLDLLEQSGKKDSIIGTLLYRGALNAARTRQEMFEKKSYPAAAAQTGQVRGKLNGREFTSIADADTRLGSRLEVFAAGDYMWISFGDIAGIEIEPPKRLRDLLWAPAKLQTGPTFRSRDLGEVLLPAMAPLSWQHPDDIVRLGRTTEWCEEESGEISPFGQKMLLVDGEEFPFLELRHLEIYAGNAAPA
ncbi:MAG TPA: type VI secretion system accessory protein TagJ [Bryobacteraceae bacterium]|nr:type VI secretion system accessory protein TagJ [Bryobacteraceae bacterium]